MVIVACLQYWNGDMLATIFSDDVEYYDDEDHMDFEGEFAF